MADRQFDIAVVGTGIAGLTAGLTAARRGRKTLVVTGDVLGGHLLSIETVDGYPGFPDGVPGYDLCPMVQEQAADAGAEFSATQVDRLEQTDIGWRLSTGEGDVIARAVVLATGSSLKELGVPGELRLRGKGVSHCATCDAPLLRNRIVVVVGGGDSGLQESLTLAEHASRVIILEKSAALTGQAVYRERIAAHRKIEVRCNTVVEDILGDDKVGVVRICDMTAGAVEDLETAGVFVYIGLLPNTALLQGQLGLDPFGAVPVDVSMRTELRGLFAAGTVRSGTPGRAASSAGDGVIAAVAADRYLADSDWR